jgi:hypothetical protein
MRSFGVKFDMRQVDELAGKISGITARTISAPMIDVVNSVATDTRRDALKVMLRSLNLEESYVEPKVELTKASNPVSPRATIVASGATITNLERYFRAGGAQLQKPVTWSNAGTRPSHQSVRVPKKGLGWVPRKGAAALGIPADYKQAGLTVAVVKGKASPFPHSFIFKSRAGVKLIGSRAKGDHKGKGKIQTKVGPSVYQMFNAALTPDFLKQVDAVLSRQVLDAAESSVRSALE